MRIRELEEKEKKESKKMADEDALRKIKLAEEQIEHLQKKLAATKQVSSLRGARCGEAAQAWLPQSPGQALVGLPAWL